MRRAHSARNLLCGGWGLSTHSWPGLDHPQQDSLMRVVRNKSRVGSGAHLWTKYQVSPVAGSCTTTMSRCQGPPLLLVVTRMLFRAPSLGSLWMQAPRVRK